ncbi:MAG: prephenate dehydrogenase [Spartobacteria bacterium]|nr:prephenate dehydrogenase [Spartobacteria bacterium]
MNTQRISIIGLGLMGASLGLALKTRGWSGTIVGYARKKDVRSAAIKRNVCDEVYDTLEDAVKDADIVVFCVPVLAIVALAERIKPFMRPGCIVTDVGSTKGWLQSQMEELLADSDILFIGSHPVAGSEKTGIAAGDADLYDGAQVVVCPSTHWAEPEEAAFSSVEHMWRNTGAEVKRMGAAFHDELLASTSHLPHVVSAALATIVSDCINARAGVQYDKSELASLCGTGYRSMTRLALGSEEVWRDIIATNREPIAGELRRMAIELNSLAGIVENAPPSLIEEYLMAGRLARLQVGEPNNV